MPLPQNFRISGKYLELTITTGPTFRGIVENLLAQRPSVFEAQFPDSERKTNFTCFIPKSRITRDELIIRGTIEDPDGQLYFELTYYYHTMAGTLKIHEIFVDIDQQLRRP